MSILGQRRLVIRESFSDCGGDYWGGQRQEKRAYSPPLARSDLTTYRQDQWTGQISKEGAPQGGLQQKSSNQSLDPVGHTSVHFPGLSNYSALFARAAFLAARSANRLVVVLGGELVPSDG